MFWPQNVFVICLECVHGLSVIHSNGATFLYYSFLMVPSWMSCSTCRFFVWGIPFQKDSQIWAHTSVLTIDWEVFYSPMFPLRHASQKSKILPSFHNLPILWTCQQHDAWYFWNEEFHLSRKVSNIYISPA
jgi:hypothetical protein